MKPITKALLLITAAVSFTACEKNTDANPKSLVGNWKQIDRFYSPGGEYVYEPAKSKNEYANFNKDGGFKSTVLTDLATYTIKDSTKVNFYTADHEERKYWYFIKGDTLTLSPAEPICIEGCGIRFVRK